MRLVVFDVDGTLVDSRREITAAMNGGLVSAGLPEMPSEAILAIVGLSLPVAVAQLLPDVAPALQDRVVHGYRESFAQARARGALAPLYPGALDCLEALSALPRVFLGIATGKPMRGLEALLQAHGLEGCFVTRQTADGHPSKPHPAMLETALREAGVTADRAVMVGDSSFDMQMARAARVAAYGVAWGFQPRDALVRAGADWIAPDYPALTRALLDWAEEEPA